MFSVVNPDEKWRWLPRELDIVLGDVMFERVAGPYNPRIYKAERPKPSRSEQDSFDTIMLTFWMEIDKNTKAIYADICEKERSGDMYQNNYYIDPHEYYQMHKDVLKTIYDMLKFCDMMRKSRGLKSCDTQKCPDYMSAAATPCTDEKVRGSSQRLDVRLGDLMFEKVQGPYDPYIYKTEREKASVSEELSFELTMLHVWLEIRGALREIYADIRKEERSAEKFEDRYYIDSDNKFQMHKDVLKTMYGILIFGDLMREFREMKTRDCDQVQTADYLAPSTTAKPLVGGAGDIIKSGLISVLPEIQASHQGSNTCQLINSGEGDSQAPVTRGRRKSRDLVGDCRKSRDKRRNKSRYPDRSPKRGLGRSKQRCRCKCRCRKRRSLPLIREEEDDDMVPVNTENDPTENVNVRIDIKTREANEEEYRKEERIECGQWISAKKESAEKRKSRKEMRKRVSTEDNITTKERKVDEAAREENKKKYRKEENRECKRWLCLKEKRKNKEDNTGKKKREQKHDMEEENTIHLRSTKYIKVKDEFEYQEENPTDNERNHKKEKKSKWKASIKNVFCSCLPFLSRKSAVSM